MTQICDDRELMAEFAQFKELLRRDLGQTGPAPEPLTQTGATSPSAPHAAGSEPGGAAQQAPEAPQINEWESARDWREPPALAPIDAESGGGRKRLFYLAAAVVVAGVAGLGWALNPWRAGSEDPALATAPPLVAPDDVAPPANEASTTPSAPPAGENAGAAAPPAAARRSRSL